MNQRAADKNHVSQAEVESMRAHNLEPRIIALENLLKAQQESEVIALAMSEAIRMEYETLNQRFLRLEAMYAELSASHAVLAEELRGSVNGFETVEGFDPEDENEEQRATRVGLTERVREIESLIRGRNRSAPVKRNMTDDDARRVLVGDVKDLGHKEAGEQIGLTYAQVYSCRLEYTFKHIHKELKGDGWKNSWVPKK